MGLFDYIVVTLVLLFLAAMIKKLFFKKEDTCNCTCGSCPMGSNCNKKKEVRK